MLENHLLFINTTIDPLTIGKTISYSNNDMIFNEGKICEEISIIISGKVIITTITLSEKEEVITILNKGEVFGDLLIFSTNPYYLGNVTSIGKTKLLLINKANFVKLLLSNKTFLENYLSFISNKAQMIKQKEKLLTHKKINDRLLYYFSQEAKKNKINEIYYKSITDLARILSLPRPSVSRAITNLEKKGFLKKNPKSITLLFKI